VLSKLGYENRAGLIEDYPVQWGNPYIAYPQHITSPNVARRARSRRAKSLGLPMPMCSITPDVACYVRASHATSRVTPLYPVFVWKISGESHALRPQLTNRRRRAATAPAGAGGSPFAGLLEQLGPVLAAWMAKPDLVEQLWTLVMAGGPPMPPEMVAGMTMPERVIILAEASSVRPAPCCSLRGCGAGPRKSHC